MARLINFHEQQNTPGAILTTDLTDPTGYGRIIRDDNDNLSKIIEEKDASDVVRTAK